MQLSVLMFPSYIVPSDLVLLCPKLWAALKHHRTVELDFDLWDGCLKSLPSDHRVIIFSSYSNDLTPLPLRQYCDRHGHLLVENELLTDVYGGIVGDTIVERLDAFLSEINPRMRKTELAPAHPPSSVR
jgi:hypothetical protein